MHNRKNELENILKVERKIMRKFLGLMKIEEGYTSRLRPRKETEGLSNIVEDIRKKRLRFYGHTSRLPANRLIDKVLTSIKTLKNIQWMIEEVNLDLDRARIFPSETSDRNLYRSKINRWEFNWREIKKTTGIKNERGSTEKK